MPPKPEGQFFNCVMCGKEFYRSISQIRAGATKTCSKQCLGNRFKGKNNPFWGRSHSIETKDKISSGRNGKLLGNQFAKGYKHTESARKKIAEASKRLWAQHGDKMINSLPRGEDHHAYKPPELRAYRLNWTKQQRREWTAPTCKWCGSAENLILDHIIPIFLGGGRYKENAQTLCQPCNLWKLYNIELPFFHSFQVKQGPMETKPL